MLNPKTIALLFILKRVQIMWARLLSNIGTYYVPGTAICLQYNCPNCKILPTS